MQHHLAQNGLEEEKVNTVVFWHNEFDEQRKLRHNIICQRHFLQLLTLKSLAARNIFYRFLLSFSLENR